MSIKIENIVAPSPEQWMAVIRGMRNPMNSWNKSDSEIVTQFDFGGNPCKYDIEIGQADMTLMKNLAKAGSDHRKYLRMLPIMMDITAPIYWIAEHDTYKVGTVRNSCSFMHRGCAKPFEINDFSVVDNRIYDVFTVPEPKQYPLVYKYDTEEYKIYTCKNGRQYKIFRNGKIVSSQYEYVDTMGRYRIFPERECSPSKTIQGYYELNLGGRASEKWRLHRLVASVWIDNPNNYDTINHIDGNKGNNCIENLEWCPLRENIEKAYENGLMDGIKSPHSRYIRWKNGHRLVDPTTKSEILHDYRNGIDRTKLAEKYDLTLMQVNNLIYLQKCADNELFESCYVWEMVINNLNDLRDEYLETKDDNVFQTIRCNLPQGYNQKYTWSANYEVLWNMYQARKEHKLAEWREFCRVIAEKVPYFKEIFEIG